MKNFLIQWFRASFFMVCIFLLCFILMGPIFFFLQYNYPAQYMVGWLLFDFIVIFPGIAVFMDKVD